MMCGAAASLAPASVWAKVLAREPTGLSESQTAFLTRVCDIVIPRTRTPSAGDVGVPAFIGLALRHGLEGTLQSNTQGPVGLALLTWLQDELHARGPDIDAATAELDVAAYVRGKEIVPWQKIKSLILTGYYTSESGATEELQYMLVPGRFDPDVPFAPGDRASSSDWIALTFG